MKKSQDRWDVPTRDVSRVNKSMNYFLQVGSSEHPFHFRSYLEESGMDSSSLYVAQSLNLL